MNPDLWVALQKAVVEAVAKKVAVIVSTRVPNGRVLPVYGNVGGGKTLQEAGAVMADNLSPQKARILAMLLLQAGIPQEEMQKYFDR